MYFYHYSKEEYKDIKSKLAQGLIEDDGNPRQYAKSISLFMEPIPLNIAKLWNDTAKHWQSGTEMFQYTIDSNDIPADIEYIVFESPEKTALVFGKQNWGDDLTPEERTANIREIEEMEAKRGYRSKGRLKLIKACKSIPKGLEKYYKEAYKLSLKFPDFEIQEKYAGAVPHLMIYLGKKALKFKSVEKITLL